jgi:hypothetical protein
MGGALPDPGVVQYESKHGYSMSREAFAKRAIDEKILNGDYTRGEEVSLTNEAYLKELISESSNGKYKVTASRELQFFIIRGGAEGFLPESLRGEDAGDRKKPFKLRSGKTVESRWDKNDLLIVFDSGGSLLSAARLERPISIPGRISAETANAVYDSWDNKKVFVYHNEKFEHLGLGLDDGWRGKTTIDMHKDEGTLGCIIIHDDHAPESDAEVAKFEPELILKILAKKGIDRDRVTSKRIYLGTMRVITIGSPKPAVPSTSAPKRKGTAAGGGGR